MYISKWWFFFALSLSLGGFWLTERLPNDWNVKTMFWVAQFFAVTLWAGVDINMVMYQAYVTQWQKRVTKPETETITNWHTGLPVAETPRADGFIPMARKAVQTVPVYPQVVSAPRYDYERNFARTLITMRNSNLKVDMTEEYWIKGGRFGESRETFLKMFDKWEHYGLSGRAGKQNKRVAKDWRKIRLVEQGNPLPEKPR